MHGGPNNDQSDQQKQANDDLMSQNNQKPNLLKPLFIVFNALAYSAYIVTIIAFILSRKVGYHGKLGSADPSDVIDGSSWLSMFYRIVAGINGLCFFILTVCLLNYGSRLEKIVHAIKVKGQHQQANNELTDQIGLSGSSNNMGANFN